MLPPHEGRGGAASCRGEGGTTLSLTLALSLTPLTRSSSLWLPLCLHPRLPCSTLLPQTLPCSILLPHTLPCSILLPQTLPCSILLPQSLPCSTLLPQTLSCSILLPLITEGWGGTLTLPIPKPPCSSLLLAILGWGWATRSPIRPRLINERGRDGAKNGHKACAPLSLPPAPAAGRTHSWRGGGGSEGVADDAASGGARNNRPPGERTSKEGGYPGPGPPLDPPPLLHFQCLGLTAKVLLRR